MSKKTETPKKQVDCTKEIVTRDQLIMQHERTIVDLKDEIAALKKQAKPASKYNIDIPELVHVFKMISMKRKMTSASNLLSRVLNVSVDEAKSILTNA